MKEEISEKELLRQWSSSRDEEAKDDEFISSSLLHQLVKISMFEEKEHNANRLKFNKVFRVAAIFICGLLLSSTTYLLIERGSNSGVSKEMVYINSVTIATGIGELRTVTLPDGTEVTLNSMSSIVYPEIFCGKKREVLLIGEAFFDVVKNKEMPFIVKTDKMDVEALGTSFEVSAYKFCKDVSATLRNGLIKVSPSGVSSKYVVVEPNQKAVIRDGSDCIDITDVVAKNAVSWKDGVLIFEDSSLSDAFGSISKRYGVDIFYNEEKHDTVKINATILKDMDINETMKVLSEIGRFKYTKNGFQYIIK